MANIKIKQSSHVNSLGVIRLDLQEIQVDK